MTEDTRAAWQKTIQEYVGECRVSAPITRVLKKEHLEKYAEGTYAHARTAKEAPGYTFHYNNINSFKIVHDATGEVAGTFAGSLVYVHPDHRGRGLMSVMYAVLDDAGIRNTHRTLTPGSLGALRGAHNILVKRALDRGEKVPDEVLAQYVRCENGSLALRAPYGPRECDDYSDHMERLRSARAILARAETQQASFVMRDPSSEVKDAFTVSRYADAARMRKGPGLRLADRLATETGGVIRMATGSCVVEGKTYCEYTAFCYVADGMAIDALGAVPEGDWEDKLLSFGVVEKEVIFGFTGIFPTVVETRDFSSARECVGWMRQNKVNFSRRKINHDITWVSSRRDFAVESHATETALEYARALRAENDLSFGCP